MAHSSAKKSAFVAFGEEGEGVLPGDRYSAIVPDMTMTIVITIMTVTMMGRERE